MNYFLYESNYNETSMSILTFDEMENKAFLEMALKYALTRLRLSLTREPPAFLSVKMLHP